MVTLQIKGWVDHTADLAYLTRMGMNTNGTINSAITFVGSLWIAAPYRFYIKTSRTELQKARWFRSLWS